MTLFGSSHKHDNTAAYETTGAGHHHHNATGAGAGVGSGHTGLPAGAGMGVGGTVPMGSSAGMTQTYPGPGATSSLTGHTGPSMTNDPYTAGGVGHTGHSTTGTIPPAGAAHHGAGPTGHTSGGGGSSVTGKVESALGSMVGSASLKAKGLEKEREAQAIKMQSGELSEAERLEKEALMRRERAVGHGAHPANSTLGGGPLSHGQGPHAGAGAGATGQYN